jgi:hypothetical protein
MSRQTIKVCEECGRQTANGESWMVMSSIDVWSAGTRDSLLHSATDLDLCSPGCLLRYISRALEYSQGRHPLTRHEVHADKRVTAGGVAA